MKMRGRKQRGESDFHGNFASDGQYKYNLGCNVASCSPSLPLVKQHPASVTPCHESQAQTMFDHCIFHYPLWVLLLYFWKAGYSNFTLSFSCPAASLNPILNGLGDLFHH
ncbi:hypothetical protein PVAP13_1KG107900 [Panicum virgatum]|uniref:Uncharacterized protein n=1 Tax=Panicum virgatum TaxID=38727 RepID=A0A8T0XN04_PANVG|nr:hypothetical protein PVAP13_1KG107900 [Panicum virgatum]